VDRAPNGKRIATPENIAHSRAKFAENNELLRTTLRENGPKTSLPARLMRNSHFSFGAALDWSSVYSSGSNKLSCVFRNEYFEPLKGGFGVKNTVSREFGETIVFSNLSDSIITFGRARWCLSRSSPTPSAAQWVAEAQRCLEAKDFQKALALFQKAAAGGQATAMDHLGLLYRDGKGVAQDYDQARQWYQKAIDAGDTKAMYDLARLYASGHGVAQRLRPGAPVVPKGRRRGRHRGHVRNTLKSFWKKLGTQTRGFFGKRNGDASFSIAFLYRRQTTHITYEN